MNVALDDLILQGIFRALNTYSLNRLIGGKERKILVILRAQDYVSAVFYIPYSVLSVDAEVFYGELDECSASNAKDLLDKTLLNNLNVKKVQSGPFFNINNTQDTLW